MRQPDLRTTAPSFACAVWDYAYEFIAEGASAASHRDFLTHYLADQRVNPWADKPIDGVTGEDIELLAEILEKKSERLARIGLSRLERLLHWASAPSRRNSYRLRSVPAAGPALVARLRLKRQFMSRAEMEYYMNASANFDSRERLFFRAIACTGFSVRHLTGMRMRQIDFERRVWRPRFMAADIPLCAKMIWILAMLRAYHDSDDFAFCVEGRPLDADAVEKMRVELAEHMDAIGRLADPQQMIRDWTFADVSRTVFLELREAGLSKDLARVATARTAPGLAGSRNLHFDHDEIRIALERYP